MTSEITVDYSKFEAKHLTFTKLEENSRSKGQLIAYSRYDPTNSGKDGVLFLQSPWIKLFTYGVPREGEYYKTDADRSHLRVPFDLSIPEVEMFVNKIKELDTIYSSPEMMETLLGKKFKKYKYQPIFREGQDQVNDDSDDENTVKKDAPPRPAYMKVKLDTTWPDNEVKTLVFNSVLDANNKRIRTKVDHIKSIDDFANAVRFLSNVRLIMRPVKLWAHNTSKKDPQCGIVFKLVKIEVEPPKSSNTMYKQIYESDNFIDSDTDEPPLPPLPSLQRTSSQAVTSATVTKNDNSDDESSGSETPIPIRKSTHQTIVEVDSEDEEEESTLVVNEESDEEEIKVESESESESEEEVPKVAKRKASNKSKSKSTTK